ncbi:hypothetical protein PPERSA_07681 [Pseudocohnilembus persalinus]|uniref:Uncharacterized protein n=1 Tax=Pseudocohnilembus persalinus TaxID=266149 RepID=A0A0V0QII2_PSEPJ|nr:hypothetical protein PPERSA_07681 [Pseudocohnilembus persalinus]|eukprot:KRX02036.1 hypothetical protein PPERSA_07681 [Pseudocohnilembus persalinus]
MQPQIQEKKANKDTQQQEESEQIDIQQNCNKYPNINYTEQINYLKNSLEQNLSQKPKGEKALTQYRKPKVQINLPQQLTNFQKIKFDTNQYDFQKVVMEILDVKNLEELEKFNPPKQNVFTYNYSKILREKVGKNKNLELLFKNFLKNVIAPHIITEILKYSSNQEKNTEQITQQCNNVDNIQKNLNDSNYINDNKSENDIQNNNEDNNFEQDFKNKLKLKQKQKYKLVYQYPPTMRVHPSVQPPKPLGKVHRDAEFGHQPGELNFWMPLLSIKGGSCLWCEQQEYQQNFQPFVLNYGELMRFWGAQLYHGAGINDTGYTRISFDFRVASLLCFDTEWKLPTVDYQHNWQVMEIEL